MHVFCERLLQHELQLAVHLVQLTVVTALHQLHHPLQRQLVLAPLLGVPGTARCTRKEGNEAFYA